MSVACPQTFLSPSSRPRQQGTRKSEPCIVFQVQFWMERHVKDKFTFPMHQNQQRWDYGQLYLVTQSTIKKNCGLANGIRISQAQNGGMTQGFHCLQGVEGTGKTCPC